MHSRRELRGCACVERLLVTSVAQLWLLPLLSYATCLQVLVVNYEDRLTVMEAPDDQDEVSYK